MMRSWDAGWTARSIIAANARSSTLVGSAPPSTSVVSAPHSSFGSAIPVSQWNITGSSELGLAFATILEDIDLTITDTAIGAAQLQDSLPMDTGDEIPNAEGPVIIDAVMTVGSNMPQRRSDLWYSTRR
ncbi:hypothetical protein FRB95_004239 [Tulasnella sp. JGI-2019a]|nr:hypothetical protein FRB95_004239 [Tulasnella sp. JGI-2019a]